MECRIGMHDIGMECRIGMHDIRMECRIGMHDIGMACRIGMHHIGMDIFFTLFIYTFHVFTFYCEKTQNIKMILNQFQFLL